MKKEINIKDIIRVIPTPLYKHDCNECVYLGSYKKVDLYFCNQWGELKTVIARYSDDGPDYTSGLELVSRNEYLAEAKRRAIEKGLL